MTRSGGFRRSRAPLAVIAVCAFVVASTSGTAAPRRVKLEKAQERLLKLEKDFELVVERYNATREELLDVQAEMTRTRLVVNEIQERMDESEGDAITLARELYMSGGPAIALGSILSASSVTELETTLEYLHASENAHAKVFENLAVDRAELNRHLAILEEDRARAVRAEERLSELRVEIEAKIASQQGEIDQLNRAIERAARRRQLQREEAALLASQSGRGIAPLSVPPNPAPAPNANAQTAVDAALSQVGKPYQWGAEGPDSYDCSGLTMWAWAQAGVSLPHNSGMQQAAIRPVAHSEIEPGDLLFFGSPIHHVSMYIGNGQMVEAPYTGAYVRVVPEDRSDFVGAGRPGV